MIVAALAALAPAAALWAGARVDRAGGAVVWATGLALWYAGPGHFLLLAALATLELAAAAVGWLSGAGRDRPASIASLAAALAPAVTCALARPLGSLPLLWDAALVGALGARAASVSGTLVDRSLGGRALRLPSLRPAPPGTPGAMSGAGTVAAATAALLLAGLGTGLELVASGDAALAATAAFLASSSVEGSLAGRLPGTARDLLAGLVGAALAAGLVAALP